MDLAKIKRSRFFIEIEFISAAEFDCSLGEYAAGQVDNTSREVTGCFQTDNWFFWISTILMLLGQNERFEVHHIKTFHQLSFLYWP